MEFLFYMFIAVYAIIAAFAVAASSIIFSCIIAFAISVCFTFIESVVGRRETTISRNHSQGLKPSVVKTLPITVFRKRDFRDGIECAVCLSNVCEGEKARVLPKCNHGFHMDCIDKWFQSHATCPLCRKRVSGHSGRNPNQESSTIEGEDELRIEVEDNDSISQSNVFPFGNRNEIGIFGPLEDVNQCVSSLFPSPSVTASASSSPASTRPEGVLAIDIPRQVNEEEAKSSVTPRLRSFMRLLSKDGRVNPSCTAHDLDVDGPVNESNYPEPMQER